MNNQTKNIVVTLTYVTFMLIFVSMCTISFFNQKETSESERRPLAQFPTEITWEGILDKSVIEDFEDYTVDQFPLREFFRSLKARFHLNVLCLKENNGMTEVDGYIAKIEPDFTDGLIDYSVGRLEYIYNKYLKDNGGDKFVSIVPDKNYFLGRDYGYPAPDYAGLVNTIKERLPGAEYVDIFECLELSDYYRTDTHWSQDKIDEVVDKLAAELGIADRLSGEYTENKLEGFKGVYYLQSALYPKPDTLVYLTNKVLDECTVYDYETGKTGKIYDLEQFESNDGYNTFLSGTKALLRIDNPNATTDEELIIFRDSFGSSLAPLLAEGYKSIYVVDIRYVMPDLLGMEKMGTRPNPYYIDFEGKDVLFMYSALVLNQKAFK